MSNILKKLNEMAQERSLQDSKDSKNSSSASIKIEGNQNVLFEGVLSDPPDLFQNGDHPGKLLQQEITRLQITSEAVAKWIKVDPKVIKSILTQTPASHPINAPLSLRLACFCGVADTFWLRLQGLYDCARYREKIRKLNIPNWTQVCPGIPARDLPHSQQSGQPQLKPLDPGLKQLIEENIQTAQVVTQGIP